PYKIPFTTLKTAVPITLPLIISKLLRLHNYPSTPILLLFSINHTNIHSLQPILSPLLSSLLILFLRSAIFSL
ncbi:aromatic acid exporter family protein, partial [Staphylococcus epidermidis]|uniref:aromatic acid exporter family protein n=1 Tax=Staphylococcus epidermidis TaxID=1282 RepID=UPI0021B4303E